MGGSSDRDRENERRAAKAALFRRAADHGVEYVEAERDGRVTPDVAAAGKAVTARLGRFDLDRPASPELVIDVLAELGRDHAVRSTGGRYFGFVTGGTDPAALAASVLASVWDQNVALPVMSPLAAAVDDRCVEWLLDLLRLPASATASFCAGASVANLTAIITARDAVLAAAGWDTAARGLAGSPPLTAVVSAEIHVSALKALRLAGIGTESIVAAPVDRWGRIDIDELPSIAGPTLVVTQAGNVNTGHSDPFGDIVDVVAASGQPAWVHVDGAFGLWAAASTERRNLVAGVERADSWATDCHKWLNVPYDCGLVAVADGSRLRATMATDAAYLGGSDGERGLMHLGLQMSQAARAIPTWATLAALGRVGVADLVDRCCDLATRFATRLDDAGATVLAPVVLNQVLVAFGSDDETDAVLAAVARSGRAWMGGTIWQGRRAMRISVSDTATDEAAVDDAVAAVLEAWADIGGDPGGSLARL